MKNVLITGATSGIGKACAQAFAQKPYRLIITGRRKERLQELKKHLDAKTEHPVLLLDFDIRNENATQEAVQSLHEKGIFIDILINNAGLAAGLAPIHEGSLSDWHQMIDTNLKGLLYISRLVSKKMVERKIGHIINISSIAGKEVYPEGNVYAATKHAVSALTKGMRMDLLPYGIKVSAVCPGLVETAFSEVRFKGDKERAAKVYQGFQPLTAEDVAQSVLFVAQQPLHVNIDDLVIMPTAQAASKMVHKEGA